MSNPVVVRIIGVGPLVERVRAVCRAAQLLETDDPRDEAVTIVVGAAHETFGVRPPVMLVADTLGPAELGLLATGGVSDVVEATASDAILVACLRRSWLRRDEQQADLWRREIEQLLSLIRDLATAPGGLPSLLHRLVLRLASVAAVQRCSLILVDDQEKGQATVVATSDRPQLQAIRISLGDYPEVREALRTREPVVVADVAHHPLLDPVRERLERAGVGAVAVFPLVDDEGVSGVLLMRSKEAMGRPEWLRLATTAAVATSIAVSHGRLVEQARDEAARELERYADLVSHLSDGVAVIDREGRIVLLNTAGRTILQADESAEGRLLMEVAPPADQIAAQLLMRQLRNGGRVLNADISVSLNGRRIVLAVSAGQLRRQKLAVLSFRDVTEQRTTEAELRSTRDFLERVIDASSDAIVAADMTGKLLIYNRAAESIFGWSVKEARTSITARNLYPEGGAQEVRRMLAESPTGQLEAVRIYGQTSTGETFPLEISAAFVKAGGSVVATVGVLRDLRERVRVERELALARQRVSEAEKQTAITALAGATAHELNQPLTVVLGHVELMRRRVSEERLVGSLKAIGEEAERMAEIVKKIAKLTRVETMSYPGEKVIADIDRSSGSR